MKSTHRLLSWKSSAVFLAVALAAAPRCHAQNPPVPSSYQDLYNTLSTDMANFNTTLSGLWNGQPYPVIRAGNLQNADANTGPSLVSGGYFSGASLELQGLKAIGVQAVLVQVGFPMLYQPFFDYLSQQPGYQSLTYDQFINLYQQVAQDVRAAGLKLIIENDVLLANDVSAGWGAPVTGYYSTLSWSQFEQARAQMALTVAQVMQPDYLLVLEQPDTEAQQTGQSAVGTVSGATDLVNTILTALQPVRGTVQVGAGVETFLPGFDTFIQSFVTLPLDFIDMHIYPINNLGPPNNVNFLQNALTIVNIAQSAGKPVTITEAWMWKMRDSEWNVLTADEIRARNPFDFWAPLDAEFQQLLENLANYAQMPFLAPEGPDYLFAYLPYNSTTENMSPGQIVAQETAAAVQANLTAAFTSTGMSYYNSLVSPPDTIPPSEPSILTSGSGSSSNASLSWTTSTDNVGVAGYYVLRNGVNVYTTGETVFTDSGLTGNTTYTYQIEAFDLAGNISPAATATITTINTTAPNPPTNVAGVPSSCQQVNLSWTASSGSVRVSSYLLFRGGDPANMVQVQQLGGSSTSFKNAGLTPGTTYYYGIEAMSTGLVSQMSNIITVTTLQPPTAPTNVMATPTAATKVSLTWSPSSGGMPIANYRVYRGTSASNLPQVATRNGTSFTDTGLTPSTTYYYAVRALDTGQNQSPLSNTVAVTTPAMPSAPVNVVASAPNAKQVSVTWSPGASALTITRYNVFRGTSPTGLTQVATRTGNSYTDASVTPGTTYYYAIQEVDSGGDVSPKSAIANATVP